jgi:hypothetical protein
VRISHQNISIDDVGMAAQDWRGTCGISAGSYSVGILHDDRVASALDQARWIARFCRRSGAAG